jgi:uncharacterized protein
MPWEPTLDDEYHAIEEQNPWWDSRSVPVGLAPEMRRELANTIPTLMNRSEPHRFHLILGPRRVGKSTIMYQVIQSLLAEMDEDLDVPERLVCMRLDHPLLMRGQEDAWVRWIRVAMANIKATPENPLLLFLDELTYARDWDRWLKTFYDERWPVRILATSSSTAALRTRRHESGVGRWTEHYLAPCLFSEYLRLRNIRTPLSEKPTLHEVLQDDVPPSAWKGFEEERRRYLLTGGFPELLKLQPVDEQSDVLRSQRMLRSDAVERAVYKDIPLAFGVQEPMKLERLLYTLAGQTGGIVSPTALRSDMELTAQTLEKYISYLEQSFLIFMLPNYSPAEGSVQRRGRKVYFVDGAVRNAALLRGITPLNDPEEMGVLFENAVAAHLHTCAMQTGGRVYYWRDGRDEVDFVLRTGGEELAFEVGSSPRHSLKGLRALMERHPRFRGRCYLVTPEALPRAATDDTPGHVSLDRFLCAVGQVADAAQRAKLV